MFEQTTSGLACSLEARAFHERLAWIAGLNRQYLRRAQREANTLSLIYDAAARQEVESLISREQDCCAFLKFGAVADGEEIRLDIIVPTAALADADALLAPFQARAAVADAEGSCGDCAVSAQSAKVGRWAWTATAASAMAVMACRVPCLLPLAFPALAATAVAGGLFGWLGAARSWLIALAVFAVAAGWFWSSRQSVKHRRPPARSTLGLMLLASLVLCVALFWSRLESMLA